MQSDSILICEDEVIFLKGDMMIPSDRKGNLFWKRVRNLHIRDISYTWFCNCPEPVGRHIYFFYEHVVYIKKYCICLIIGISFLYIT